MVVGIVNLHLTVKGRVALGLVVHAKLVEELELGAALWHTVGTHSFFRLSVLQAVKMLNGERLPFYFKPADVRSPQLMAAIVRKCRDSSNDYMPSFTDIFVGFSLLEKLIPSLTCHELSSR